MNDKPKCPVFGCTIPRGIPHEHPAGVSAVMRDPAAPLSADERAELDQLRARVRQSELLTAARMPGVYVVPADAPIHVGRKFRDELIAAGHNVEHFDAAREATLEAIKPRLTFAQLVGKIMSWLLGIPCLLLMCFVIGHQFGWWL